MQILVGRKFFRCPNNWESSKAQELFNKKWKQILEDYGHVPTI